MEVSNILSGLKELSDSADVIIGGFMKECDRVDEWFTFVKKAVINIQNATQEELKCNYNLGNLHKLDVFLKKDEQRNKQSQQRLISFGKKDHLHGNGSSNKNLNLNKDVESVKLEEVLPKQDNPTLSTLSKSSTKNETTGSCSVVSIHSEQNSKTEKRLEESSEADSVPGKKSKYSSKAKATPQKQKNNSRIKISLENQVKDILKVEVKATEYSHRILEDKENSVSRNAEERERNLEILNSPLVVNLVTPSKSPYVKLQNMILTDSVSQQTHTPKASKRKSSLPDEKQDCKKQVTYESCQSVGDIKKSTRGMKKIKDNIGTGSLTCSKTPVNRKSAQKKKLDDIQKKEAKANQALQKVLSERQLKLQENKRKREEKMEKTLRQRQKIEKEREEKKQSHLRECESVHGKTKSAPKNRNQPKAVLNKVVKPSPPLNKDVVSTPNQFNATFVTSASPAKSAENVKLPDVVSAADIKLSALSNSSEKCNKYIQKSSKFASPSSFVNYDLSDTDTNSDDEDERPRKPFPSWAFGLPLRNALLHQLYNPPDTDVLFGNFIKPPNLSELLGITKKEYNIRSSSAIWHSPVSICE
ncbi:inner centromere protein-like [Stegodyphus dumicola]|uniref:inner centromere protein-like n=1 Tax=Stegodyphus dumicola TaxID=202533 RepID=UPI0015AED43E|nr:inner centromere protein-like [Stegodyphus dumicola]XP_035232865.1 inner centromere protein-like [Stegodyphus dumicola]